MDLILQSLIHGIGGSNRSDKGSIGANSLPGSLGVTTDYVNKDNNNPTWLC